MDKHIITMNTDKFITESTRKDLLRIYLSMGLPELKNQLEKKDNLTLNWLSEDIALRYEFYEMCAIIQKILNSRKQKD